ncbi:MAG TPA: tyrosine-type recombinase/integrase [Pyrinomonadaceae bacterium]|jgi:integrase
MAIKEITQNELGKTKTGWRWDRRRGVWVTFQVDTQFNGARHIRRGFRTAKEAESYIEQLKMQERLKEIGVASLVKYPKAEELFEKYAESLTGEAEAVRARRVFRTFLKILPAAATVDEIGRKHTKDYIDFRMGEGVKTETADRELNCISAALKKAGDFYAELENWRSPAIYRPAVADDTRQRVVTKDERERLLGYFFGEKQKSESAAECAARRRTGLVFYFGLLTGLRHGEICAVEKINFDLPARRLKVERFKTKRSGVRWTIFEPLTPTQIWVLSEAARLYPEGKFFFSEKGKIHGKTYSIFEAACRRLKIPYGKKTPNGLIIHDTRHSFVTALEHGAVDSSTTRSFSGHSKDAMLKRYAHATQDSRAGDADY